MARMLLWPQEGPDAHTFQSHNPIQKVFAESFLSRCRVAQNIPNPGVRHPLGMQAEADTWAVPLSHKRSLGGSNSRP